jgi:hypothetical protein
VVLGLGLAVCSIAQTPTPWTQLHRLGEATREPVFRDNASTRFIAARTHRGERVALLTPAGHRTAHDLGLVNVSPYSSSESIVTRHQLADTVADLRAAGGTRVFLLPPRTATPLIEALLHEGFRATELDPASQTAELVDRRVPITNRYGG